MRTRAGKYRAFFPAKSLLAGCLIAVVATEPACRKRGPTDVGNQNPRSQFEDGPGGKPRSDDGGNSSSGASSTEHVLASPTKGGRIPREIAKASTRAITTSATHVYFGNTEDDTIYRLAKAGTESIRIARRAPMPGGISVAGGGDASTDSPELFWIGSPGDAILRVSIKATSAPTTATIPMTTFKEGSVFANLAVSNSEVFWTEVHGTGGTLMRAGTGASGTAAANATRLASFEGAPRGLALDESRVFVATSTRLAARSRTGAGANDLIDLTTGSAFAYPCLDDTWLYATATDPRGGRGRVLGRVKKSATSASTFEVIATNVRPDAPIAARDGEVYWFDATQPVLFAAAAATPSSSTRFVSEDPVLDHVYGLTVDDDGAFIATGYGEGGRILRVLLH